MRNIHSFSCKYKHSGSLAGYEIAGKFTRTSHKTLSVKDKHKRNLHVYF